MALRACHGTARFGGFTLDLASGELSGAGTTVRLRDKPFEVLALLIEHPGEVVTREQFRERLWPADVFVDFDNNLNAAVNRLRDALGDSARAPQYLETVPRRGYRLLPPVGITSPHPDEALPARVIVLPLDDLDPVPGQDYFAAGLTEELTSQLTMVNPSRLHVIARTTAQHYAGTAQPLASIGRELGVAYIVQGSARRFAGRVRISVQLVRAEDETHVWARTYDAEVRDVLDLQTDLARAIAAEIEGTVAPAGRRAGVDCVAYEAYLRGRFHERHLNEPGAWDAAVAAYREAVNRDPGFARAWAALASAHIQLAFWGLVPPASCMPLADNEASHAAALQPDAWEAQSALGLVE